MNAGEAMAASADALTEVKAYLRVDGSGEDAAIGALIEAAAAVCETFGGVTLIARMFDETLAPGTERAWTRLARTPVRAVESVGAAGGPALAVGAFGPALPVGAFATDIDANGDGWVRLLALPQAFAEGRARVRYRAGLAEGWTGLPAPLRQGVVRLAAHLYVHRDGADDVAPPAAVTALWRPYRRMRLR